MNSVIKTSVVLFGILEESNDNYRKLSSKSLGVLLVKRNNKYILPEYECNDLIDLDNQSRLAVDICCGLKDVYVEQLYTFSSVNNGCLFVNPCFLGLISKGQMYEGIKSDCYWCELKIKESENNYKCKAITSEDKFEFEVYRKLKEHTTDRYKFSEVNSGLLGDNVSVTLISAFERLRNKINYTDIVFNMMGERFTLKELQQVYETIGNKPLLDAAFRRVIASKVEETDEMLTGIGCRPSKLYRYKDR